MTAAKIIHKLGKRLEDNYTWYQVQHIKGILADVLSTVDHKLVYPPTKIKYIMVPNIDGSAVRYIREDLCRGELDIREDVSYRKLTLDYLRQWNDKVRSKDRPCWEISTDFVDYLLDDILNHPKES